MPSGLKVVKREFLARCGTCKNSTEPGWLWLGGGDWVECPECNNISQGIKNSTPGFFTGLETQLTPTRKIILPSFQR